MAYHRTFTRNIVLLMTNSRMKLLCAIGVLAMGASLVSGTFTCGDATSVDAGQANMIVLNNCAAKIAYFNAHLVWGQLAGDTEVQFACADTGEVRDTPKPWHDAWP